MSNPLLPYYVGNVSYFLTLQQLPDNLTNTITFNKVPNRVPQQPGIFYMISLKERLIKKKRKKVSRRFDKRSF